LSFAAVAKDGNSDDGSERGDAASTPAIIKPAVSQLSRAWRVRGRGVDE
jgi:hypothetical protein